MDQLGTVQATRVSAAKPFFDKLSLTEEKAGTLRKHAKALVSYVRSREGDSEWVKSKYTTLVDNLSDMIMQFMYAVEEPS
jgi:hypothetical protein